jgi:hypothetical protein
LRQALDRRHNCRRVGRLKVCRDGFKRLNRSLLAWLLIQVLPAAG